MDDEGRHHVALLVDGEVMFSQHVYALRIREASAVVEVGWDRPSV